MSAKLRGSVTSLLQTVAREEDMSWARREQQALGRVPSRGERWKYFFQQILCYGKCLGTFKPKKSHKLPLYLLKIFSYISLLFLKRKLYLIKLCLFFFFFARLETALVLIWCFTIKLKRKLN